MAAEPDPASHEAMQAEVTSGVRPSISGMACCCGSASCSVLKHNSTVLDSVESDVFTAAKMGKALLIRHEAYMESAERDRLELTTRIEQLEINNRELEAKNARTIEENRSLLDELESLNTSVSGSEDRIKDLEATILSSQQIIRRLEGETARAESLERQLASLEEEQAALQQSLVSSREDVTSAMYRWKRAERGINDLEELVERMEHEAKETRERHAEMMGRMEKQREVEKALGTAAGRLKAAAAVKSLNQGSSVVSHVVRELLDDNLSLQHSITELRQILDNSNSEIQALREQLMFHQPLADGEASAASTLRAELEAQGEEPLTTISEEVHIHHHMHYHAAPKAETKKPKKKRQGITPGIFVPPPHMSLPSTPPTAQWRAQAARNPRDSMQSNRWSVLSEQPSEFALSSVPSSPQSTHRNSLFDPAMIDSIPGSPTTSVDPMSPTWRAHRKYPSNMSSRSFQVPTHLSLTPTTSTHNHAIIEEGDDVENMPDLGNATDESTADDESTSKEPNVVHDEVEIYLEDLDSDQEPRRRLRRAHSHESIMSLSGGLDIHTLKSRPSQLTLRHLSSVTSVTASSTVTAQPMLSRDPAKRSSVLLRDSYGSSPRTPQASLRAVSGPSSSSHAGSSRLGNWAGWRPWGGATSGGGGGASGGGISGASTPTKPDRDKELQRALGRPPGINQAGAIPGFYEYWAAHQKRPPSKVLPDIVDRDALREGLAE